LPEASICLSELRHLRGKERQAVQELRDRYEQHLRDIVDHGIASGIFRVADRRLAVFAVLGMITGVIGWYSPAGPLTAAQISATYSDLALAALGALLERVDTIR
jgi:hypothetical protein